MVRSNDYLAEMSDQISEETLHSQQQGFSYDANLANDDNINNNYNNDEDVDEFDINRGGFGVTNEEFSINKGEIPTNNKGEFVVNRGGLEDKNEIPKDSLFNHDEFNDSHNLREKEQFRINEQENENNQFDENEFEDYAGGDYEGGASREESNGSGEF